MPPAANFGDSVLGETLSSERHSSESLSKGTLACEDHDYLEIVCMFHYMINVMDKKGQTFKGKARDVLINEEKNEVLVLQDIASEMHIPTNEIASLNVLTPNARFEHIVF